MATAKKTSVAPAGNQKSVKNIGGKVRIKWVVSFISCTDDMRATIRGLGLRRLHQVVERQDTPETRGMIHKVRHLVEVVE
jgi:large subunit ribosomal protein L30